MLPFGLWSYKLEHYSCYVTNMLLLFCSAIVLIFYVYKISSGGNEVYFPVSAE
jgi:hypothetical protein